MKKESKKQVAIIETEPEMRIFLSNLLKSNSYRTTIPRTGHEIETIKTSRPDLIILDAMMPRAGAIQLYQIIKSDEVLSCIPVIMLSTVDQKLLFKYSRQDLSLPQPDNFLEKPPEAEELLEIIQKLINKKTIKTNALYPD